MDSAESIAKGDGIFSRVKASSVVRGVIGSGRRNQSAGENPKNLHRLQLHSEKRSWEKQGQQARGPSLTVGLNGTEDPDGG